jgi:hypothetical protein
LPGVVSIDFSSHACAPQRNGIHFIWPKAVLNAPGDVCDVVVHAVGSAAGLEDTKSCGDAMAFGAVGGCGGPFTDADLPCVKDRWTQNSFQTMAEVFGRCP